MLTLFNRWRRELDDRFRYGALSRALLSRWTAWRAGWMRRGDPQQRADVVARLCAAARLANSDAAIARLQERIRREVASLDQTKVDLGPFAAALGSNWMVKAAILKPYRGPREKGVIFVSFESQWAKLLRYGDVRDFASRYTLVVSPSSSPHNLVNYLFAANYPEPYFTLISNPEDLVELPRVSDRLLIVPLFASHWVNPDLFQTPPLASRPFDLLMVASFGKVKRHHILFRALRNMPRDLRVLLIGQDQEGRTAETIRQEARWYGVEDRFELRANQPFLKVVEAFGQAKTSLVLSKREGSCVVVAESMFADTPVALLHGAHLGSRVFINEQTGRFLLERFLSWQLTEFIRDAERFKPRAWALARLIFSASRCPSSKICSPSCLSTRARNKSSSDSPANWSTGRS